jgi:hypothetical protein
LIHAIPTERAGRIGRAVVDWSSFGWGVGATLLLMFLLTVAYQSGKAGKS